MAANTSHLSIINNQPKDENIKLWRYLNKEKFIDLITTHTLYLRRADKFEDTFEGTIPKANNSLMIELEKTVPNISILDKMNRITIKKVREWTYINCWHINEYESDAMWKIYCKDENSVAITTTYNKLKKSLPDDVYLGLVNYIDFEKEHLKTNDILLTFFKKRIEFKHENEVRIIKPDNVMLNDNFFNTTTENLNDSLKIPFNLVECIDTIYLSQTSSIEFKETIYSYCKKYNLNFEIKSSILSKSPLY